MEFLEKSHTYLNDDGIIIPSVTQLIAWKFGSGYDDVPKEILNAKAEYGSQIHYLIEQTNKGINPECNGKLETCSLRAYKIMASKLPKVKESEKMVCFDNRLAGTVDIIYENGEIGDIKTYAQLDSDKLLKTKWQISLYYLCLGTKQNSGYLLHIPKSMKYSKQQLDTFSFEECIKLLEEYEACH